MPAFEQIGSVMQGYRHELSDRPWTILKPLIFSSILPRLLKSIHRQRAVEDLENVDVKI